MIFSQKSIFATCIYSQQAWFYIHYLSYYLLVNSPIGEIFRARLRQFPALVNCCTIDWFSPWPQEALQSVAWRFLGDLTDLDDGSNIPGIVSTVKPHRTSKLYTITDSFVCVCVTLWIELGQYFEFLPWSAMWKSCSICPNAQLLSWYCFKKLRSAWVYTEPNSQLYYIMVCFLASNNTILLLISNRKMKTSSELMW